MNTFRCKNYPPEFNLDKTIAKEYFREFGKLKRVVFKPKLRLCTVEYFTKESFLKALNNAGEYKGNIFEVSVETTNDAKRKRTIKTEKPIWVDDNEVEAELKAMSGVGGRSILFPSEGNVIKFYLCVHVNIYCHKILGITSKPVKRKKTNVWNVGMKKNLHVWDDNKGSVVRYKRII